MTDIENRPHTVKEVAGLLQISLAQIYRLIDLGMIRTISFSVPGGTRKTYRVPPAEVLRLINEGPAPVADQKLEA